MSEHSPAPWRWTEDPPARESEQKTVRLVDANGEDVAWGYQVGLYDDDLPAAIDASDADRLLMAAAPQLLAALKREHDANHPFPVGILCGCTTCRIIAGAELTPCCGTCRGRRNQPGFNRCEVCFHLCPIREAA